MKYDNQSNLKRHMLFAFIRQIMQNIEDNVNASIQSQLDFLTEKLGEKKVQEIINELFTPPDIPRDGIIIFKDKTIHTHHGDVVCSGYIEPEGYISDLFVVHGSGKDLYDDSMFMNGIDEILIKLGYQGRYRADRAELGMQDYNFVAIEPDETLQDFFVKKFGFKVKK